MPETAKLFRVGGSQAVRLPKAYRFVGESTVSIRRVGRRVILEPAPRAWPAEFVALAGSAPGLRVPDEPPTLDPGPDLGR